MPDPGARDPHSLVFSRSGLIIFTVQGGSFVGTLDPRTGNVSLVALTGGAAPYGIALNSKDVPFFDEFGTNKIGSLDPKTLKVTEYPLPAAGARPRRSSHGEGRRVPVAWRRRGPPLRDHDDVGRRDLVLRDRGRQS